MEVAEPGNCTLIKQPNGPDCLVALTVTRPRNLHQSGLGPRGGIFRHLPAIQEETRWDIGTNG